MSNHRRICIRCKENKLLTIGNYKKREAYLDLKPPFDRMCRVCRDSNDEKNRMARKKYLRKRPDEIECANPDCDKIFTPIRIKTRTCSKRCSKKVQIARIKLEREQVSKLEKKPINNEFLVRGRIKMEGYGCSL